MFKARFVRRRYLFAGLVAVAAGGLLAGVGTRAAPKIMSRVCEQMMHKMLPELKKQGCEAGDVCKQTMAGREAPAEQQTCEA